MSKTIYTIYLVNESSSLQRFWCFLERPKEIADDDKKVFANSSVYLDVASHSANINTFTIPVQYRVGAGASNQAVGLNIKVNSTIMKDASLDDKFQAKFYKPNQGPDLEQDGTGAGKKQISIGSNPFNQVEFENQHWFSNMSFGIQTQQGFLGMTWSPSPNQTRTLTPRLKFYVAVGTYGANDLASYKTISNGSAEIPVPSKFSASGEATVRYTSNGTWEVEPGKPEVEGLASVGGNLASMLRTQLHLSQAHSELVTLMGRSTDASNGDRQRYTVEKVEWKEPRDLVKGRSPGKTFFGKLFTKRPLAASFTAFVLSGIRFDVKSSEVGQRDVSFSYHGDRSWESLKEALKPGAEIRFDD